LLLTQLTELERAFMLRRIDEEKAALQELSDATLDAHAEAAALKCGATLFEWIGIEKQIANIA
jgi:hypothetical protein